jgi:hypothetical protein
MLIKLANLRWHQRRNRPPYLVGNAAGFDFLLVGRHSPPPGEPDFTLFVGRFPTTTGAKPLPPIWDPEKTRWIGPENENYPGFYDDTAAAIADLEGRPDPAS